MLNLAQRCIRNLTAVHGLNGSMERAPIHNRSVGTDRRSCWKALFSLPGSNLQRNLQRPGHATLAVVDSGHKMDLSRGRYIDVQVSRYSIFSNRVELFRADVHNLFIAAPIQCVAFVVIRFQANQESAAPAALCIRIEDEVLAAKNKTHGIADDGSFQIRILAGPTLSR